MINAGGLVVHEKKKPPGREVSRKWLESTKGGPHMGRLFVSDY